MVFCKKIYSFNTIQLNNIVVFRHKSMGLMIKKVVAIEDNKYFLRGENPDSIDSRNFGSLPKKELLYKVLFKVRSL